MTSLDSYKLELIQILKPIVYIAIGFASYEIISTLIKRASEKNLLKKRHHQKRAKTITGLIINIVKYLIIIFVIIAILANFGVNVKSIIAGLGVTAAIIGLALQDIAKDLIAGVSIILEDQYEIGDTVEVNGFMGEVVGLGLRSTRIKNFKGQTLIIANHTITEIINYNLSNNLAIVDISVGYEEDLNKVEKVLNDMAKSLKGKIPKTKGDIKVLGIDDLEASGVIYRVTVETIPAEHFDVQRVLRREIKDALDKENIKIPYQQVEVHNG